MNKLKTTEKNELNRNYPLLDLTQYIASLFVILIHCGRLAESDFLHFTLKVFLGRLAVPLFLVTAGYFFYLKQRENPKYARSYFKRQWQVYFFWSMIYLPYGIWFVKSMPLDPKLYLAAVPVGLGYLGFCYHLWYFPALFLGFFLVRKLLKRLNYRIVFCICFLLFTLGATETYIGYLQGTKIQAIYTLYQHLFLTTRNGLFYTPIFILIGFFLASRSIEKSFSKRHRWQYLVASLLLLAIESLIVCSKQGTDKNFLFSLVPVSLFSMDLLLHAKIFTNRDFSHLRKASQSLYFLHPIFLESSKWTFKHLGFAELQGIPLFLITFALTTLSVRILAGIKVRWADISRAKKFTNNLEGEQDVL